MTTNLEVEKHGGWLREVDEESVKQFLSFFLNFYRAKLSLLKNNSECVSAQRSAPPFDYDLFLGNFRWLIRDDEFQNSRISHSAAKVQFMMKFVVEQGLLDPLLPYLKSTLKIRKSPRPLTSVTSTYPELISSTTEVDHETEIPGRFLNSSNPKKRLPKEDPLVVIHVCEEGKGIWQDFPCRQNVLLAGMGYFTRVAVKGQSLLDMDISVHCEIDIFQWLLDWILPSTNQKEKISQINAVNVVGLVVSAEFLQMPTLTSICLRYICENIEVVVVDSPNLVCLSDTLLARLAGYFQNGDIERRVAPRDKSDRITSRLYLQFILLMNSAEPCADRGHVTSTSTLFKCRRCKQLLTNHVAASVPCADVRIDSFGYQFSVHVKDLNWNFLMFVKDLKRELRNWRRVYWRLWGTVNFLFCLSCNCYYAARFKNSCKFHPTERHSQKEEESRESRVAAQYYRNFGKKPFEFPAQAELDAEEEAALYGRKYLCCNTPSYKFSPLTLPQGCRTRSHVPDLSQKNALAKLEIFESFEDLIVQEIEPDILKHLGKLRHTEAPIRRAVEEYIRRSPSVGSSTQDGEWSSPERELDEVSTPAQTLAAQYGFGRELKESPRPAVSDLWTWNADLSTRYNQDMQRDLEEKYMFRLANNLLQRTPLSKF